MIELLYFSCWVEARSTKSAFLSVKVGKRAPTFVKNYYPGTKIHIFDGVNRNQLPMIEISFNDIVTKSFNLSNYKGHETQPHVDIMQDIRILFTFELLQNTEKIYDKYCHQKSDTEKHFLCEGVKDYIRSQQEFLAQFERNEEIQQIRRLEAEQSRCEKDLCDQIMNTKKYSLSIGKILLIIMIFLFVGFLIGRHDVIKKGSSLTNLFYPDDDRSYYYDDQIIDSRNRKNHFKAKSNKVLSKNLKAKKGSKTSKSA